MPLPSELLLFLFSFFFFILKLVLVYFRNLLFKIFRLHMHSTLVPCFIRMSSASTWGTPKGCWRSSPVQRTPALSFMIPHTAHMQLTGKEVELPSSVGSISLKQMSKKHPSQCFRRSRHISSLQTGEWFTRESKALQDELHLHKTEQIITIFSRRKWQFHQGYSSYLSGCHSQHCF